MARGTFITNYSDEDLRNSFDKALATPMLWVLKAQDLLKASRLLEEHDLLFDAIKTQKGFSKDKSNLTSVILMLRGMGLECLLKGELTKQGKIIPKDGELELSDKYKKHNLRNMAQDVEGLALTEDEYITLSTLSRQISLGRLPIRQVPTKQEMSTVGWTMPHDETAYHSILEKVLAIGESPTVSA